MSDRDAHGRFTKNNQILTKHGADGALRKLTQDQPFDGVALAVYNEVMDELGINLDLLTGVDRVRVKRAARFEAVTRLFEGAALAASVVGDLAKWERYQQRAGWLGSKAYMALTGLRELVLDGSNSLIIDAVQAAREAQNGHNETD